MRRIGIVGGGRFGKTLAISLANKGIEVVLLDRHREAVEELAPSISNALIGDATQVESLMEAGMGNCDAVVVTISENIEASILTTLALKEMEVPYIVARAFSEMHGRALEKIGADRIVNPARDIALRLSKSLVAASVHDYLEVADGISVIEVNAPAAWFGKTLSETGMRNKFGVMILAINHHYDDDKVKTVVAPSGNDKIKAGDSLVVFGHDDKLQEFEKSPLLKKESEESS